ncbi:peptidoglycan recognition protein family protein [Intestinimonas sp. HCP28S3_D6]|uniref:peptidoglycan recognition protein family protein n=1 Tax=Intestinimonas sp. HCP28S3_D6 TaxID=3438942 RepID=UPI003F8C498A
MELTQHILTQSGCYKAGRTIVPKGIMVHSTGVAQPDPAVFLKLWDQPGADACVHALVHQGGVIQTLPWNHRAWHAGSPRNGGLSANNTHIAFEILEPKGHTYQGGTMVGYDVKANAAYFDAVYRNAVELTAWLCRQFSLDPMTQVVDHQEGCKLDIASNHADVMHWFPKHGKSMDTFRADVAALLKGEEEDTMDQNTFDTMLTEALARRAAAQESKPVSDWAKEAWEAAVAAGVFDGTKPQAPLTREQAAAVLARLGKLN